MNLNILKEILEETQRRFPPHYPTKRHGISSDDVDKLLEQLKLLIDFLGFSQANIAIKNIVGKMLSQFLIDVRGHNTFSNFEIINESIENGNKIIINANNKKIEIDYLNDGTILLTNDIYNMESILGKSYSNSTISYNNKDSDILFCEEKFLNNIVQSIMTFDKNGIEIKKSFKLFPYDKRAFDYSNQCIVGFLERTDDYFYMNFYLKIIGDDFGKYLSSKEIEEINSLPMISVPVSCLGGLDTDLNLLFLFKDNRISVSSITQLAQNYLYYADFEDYDFYEFYNRSKNNLINSVSLESILSFGNLSLPLIYSPYTNEIFNNIKNNCINNNDNKHSKK